MNDEFQQVIAQWWVATVISLIAVLVRLLLSAERCTVFGVLRGITVGLFVGLSVNLYLADVANLGDGTRGAIVGVSAVLAEDLVVALLVFGRDFRSNPKAALRTLLGVKR